MLSRRLGRVQGMVEGAAHSRRHPTFALHTIHVHRILCWTLIIVTLLLVVWVYCQHSTPSLPYPPRVALPPLPPSTSASDGVLTHSDGVAPALPYVLSSTASLSAPVHETSSARPDVSQTSLELHEQLVRRLSGCRFMQRRMDRGLGAKWEALQRPDVFSLWSPHIGRRVLVLLGPMIANMHHQLEHGGPSGDFVQWADLLSVMTLAQTRVQLVTAGSGINSLTLDDILFSDLLFMDYNSLWLFHDRVDELQKGLWPSLLCRLRVIDFFGSEAWSLDKWFHSDSRGADLHQVWTAFPYLPNNTFLGFAVMPIDIEEHDSQCNRVPRLPAVKKDQVVLWGKDVRYFAAEPNEHNDLYDVAHLLTVIRSAFGDGTVLLTSLKANAVVSVPSLAVVHAKPLGPLTAVEFTDMVRQSAALIGVSAPIDGISWLEAVAEGTPFINPRIRPAIIQRDRPHRRPYHSQVQYAEQVEEPYVYNLNDSSDEGELRQVVSRIRASAFSPYIVPDFCVDSFAQRVVTLLRYQDFCLPSNTSRSHEATHTPPACRCPYCISCRYAHQCTC